MTKTKAGFPGVLTAIAFVLAASAIPAAYAATADETAARQQQHMQKFQAHMKARLDKMAARLEIKASQQAAWADYVKAREATMGSRPMRPAKDADAATIARSRAEFAAGMAQKLALMSDATAKLQAVLDENQQKTLNQMARRGGQRGGHGHRGMHDRGEAGMHGKHADAMHARGMEGQHGQHGPVTR
jgi:hypothetical protein